MLRVVISLLFAATNGADTTRVDVERLVQAVVIDSLFVRDTTRQVVVGDSTVIGGSHFVDEDYQSALRMLGTLPAGLQADFESVRGHGRAMGPLPLRRPVVSMSAEVRQRMRAIRNPAKYWAAFFDEFPGTPGRIEVSRVGLSPDGRSALVLVEYGCGGMCGGTLYLLVQRDGDRWRITRKAQPRIV